MKLYRANGERQCCRCPAKIKAGETYYGYRELALTSHEAAHHGRYPKRILCRACAAERNAAIARAQIAAAPSE